VSTPTCARRASIRFTTHALLQNGKARFKIQQSDTGGLRNGHRSPRPNCASVDEIRRRPRFALMFGWCQQKAPANAVPSPGSRRFSPRASRAGGPPPSKTGSPRWPPLSTRPVAVAGRPWSGARRGRLQRRRPNRAPPRLARMKAVHTIASFETQRDRELHAGARRRPPPSCRGIRPRLLLRRRSRPSGAEERDRSQEAKRPGRRRPLNRQEGKAIPWSTLLLGVL